MLWLDFQPMNNRDPDIELHGIGPMLTGLMGLMGLIGY